MIELSAKNIFLLGFGVGIVTSITVKKVQEARERKEASNMYRDNIQKHLKGINDSLVESNKISKDMNTSLDELTKAIQELEKNVDKMMRETKENK